MLLEQYLPVLALIFLALGLGVALTLVSILLGPKKITPAKKKPFESGMPSDGAQYRRYSVRFYMVALTFLIFDVEIVFFYPWAVKFRELGFYGLGVMSVFFVILTLGLVYDWKKGALEWE
ncbi:MAG: NADH-quinone oxidoreductase subunit A [Deltaproteobacteria bacterium]|nr:NADH-quinone oxidoreductase subunit A [Deltaproteobacteria bacterium]